MLKNLTLDQIAQRFDKETALEVYKSQFNPISSMESDLEHELEIISELEEENL